MRVSCPSCQTNYNIDDKRIPPGGAKLKCAKCQTMFPIRTTLEAVPLPGGPGQAATDQSPAPSSKQTRMFGASDSAVPLPGTSPVPPPPPSAPSAKATQQLFGGMGPVPLPGGPGKTGGAGHGLGAPAAVSVPLPSPGAIPLPGLSAKGPPTAAPVAGEAFAIPPPPAAPGPAPRRTDPFARAANAVPLPGITSAPVARATNLPPTGAPRWDEESTRVASEPLPAAAFPVPLPAPLTSASAGAIPLPGAEFDLAAPAADESAIPFPRAGQDFAAAPQDDAVPLPGADFDLNAPATDESAIPFPRAGQDFAAAPQDDAVPLPGSEFDLAAPVTDAAAMPFPSAPRAFGAPHQGDAVPLPGSEFDLASPATDAAAIPLPGSSVEFSSPSPFPAPSSQAAFGSSVATDDVPEASPFDFTEAPAPERAAQASDPFDFADTLSSGVQSPSFSLDDLPAPKPPPAKTAKAPAPATSDLEFDLPTPANANANLPSPAAPSLSFGEIELGEPAGKPSTTPADALEFDPTSAPPKDDLEVDLSAPLPQLAQGPADGLEMLDFIDSAKGSTDASRVKVTRHHVRRRSGKVFGPFEEAVIVKMLEDGQLLGNEEISLDGERWSAIGSSPSYKDAVQRLLEAPSKTGATAEAPVVPQSMEKLKQLYEGRMAAVAVVSQSTPRERLRKLVPVALGLVVVAAVAGAGVYLGRATPYGYFGLKLILPQNIKPGSAEHAVLEKAKAALLADTFQSYQQARDAARGLLNQKEYPEARAVWCQAVFYLERRYAAARADLPQAVAHLESIRILGDKHVEVAKAVAGHRLLEHQPDQALAVLPVRADTQGDLEVQLLRAEAQFARGDFKQAQDAIESVLKAKKDSAKALHALGNLHQARRSADEAAKAYAEALAADANHVASALELSAIELLIRKDVKGGVLAVDQALSAERRDLMGPAERARALALKAIAKAEQHEPEEAIALFKEALEKHDPNSLFAKAHYARVLIARHDHETALPLVQEAATKEPGRLEYTEGYLAALIALGKMDDANRVVAEAERRFPGNARLAYLNGRINEALDAPKDAESAYLRAVGADPTMFEPNLYLGRMHLRFKRNADARAQLEQAATKAPQSPAVRVGLGELALAEDDLTAAAREFDTALKADPNFAEAHLGLSRVFERQGDLAAARKSIDRALELDPKVKNGSLQHGVVAWKEGKLDQALAELEKAKVENPGSSAVLVVLSAVKLEKGDTSGAETSALAALKGDPSAEVYLQLALVKNRRGEHTQAIEYMRDALARAPKRPDYHYQLGRMLRDGKKIGEAIAEWEAAVELRSDYADALEALGLAHFDRSRFEDARGYFDAALKADPTRANAQAAAGDCYLQTGRWNEAIKRYQKALTLNPALTQLYFKVARSYSEKNQTAEAIKWYRRSTTADADNAMAWYHLGYAFKEKGQRKDAIVSFKTYLAKKPDAEDRREIEDEIYDLEH